MTVFFIRHAESEGNVGLATVTPTETKLTAQGEQQAKDLLARIDFKPDLIIHSTYIRTYQTAKPLAEKYPDVPVQEWQNIYEFTFLSPSKYKNTTKDERKPFIDEYIARNDMDFVDGVGAESFNHFLQRVDETIEKVSKFPETMKVIIFAHGAFLRAFRMRLLGQEVNIKSFWASDISMKNAEIFKFKK
ncbi:MAG: phosphoglycerate mutase family protein [Alphaproteobacteria bacterium]|nr:phosphoglycerate mutase family protein [Alphaproteobacteria bacterium]